MALTDTQKLYNVALGYLGEYEVTETGASTKQYILCERYYPKTRDEVLCSHPWNEAKVRAVLAREADSPLFGYNYKYALPDDSLRILSIGSDLYDWEVEGGYIKTNYGQSPGNWATGKDYVAGQYVSYSDITYLCAVTHTSDVWADEGANWTSTDNDYVVIHVEYVKQLTSITEFSVRLYDAIAIRLAIKIAVGITGDPKIKEALLNEYINLTLPQARSVDAMQGKPKRIMKSEWKRSRR